MRVALYLRVSKPDARQDNTFQDPENQRRQLLEYCIHSKYEVTQEYVDKASAGGIAKRDCFKQMLEDASKRKFDLILFWSLDRFSRGGVLKTLSYLQMLTDYGVGYKSYTEQYLDSCGIFKDAVISILATMAKQERIRLSERVKAGMARAKQGGLILGRKSVTKSHSRNGVTRPGVDINKVIELRKEGMSYRAIGTKLRISAPSVMRLLRVTETREAVTPPATAQGTQNQPSGGGDVFVTTPFGRGT